MKMHINCLPLSQQNVNQRCSLNCLPKEQFLSQILLRILNKKEERILQLSQPQLNRNLTQPNITKVGFDMKMSLHIHPPLPIHHPPTTQTQCQQYLSCYLADFDEILTVGSWEHLEHI